MLGHSASISIKYDRFGRYFHNIIDGTETGSHVYQLDIRLSFCSGITQRADPHGIKLSCLSILVDNGIFHDQTSQTAMCLHGCDRAFHLNGFAESSTAHIRQRQICSCPALQTLVFLITGVWELHQLSAILSQYCHHFFSHRLLESSHPVISMNHKIWSYFLQIFLIAQGLLLYHTTHATNIFKQCLSLRKRQKRISFIADHRFIRQHTDDQTSQAGCFPDNGNVTTVQHICGKTHIDCAVLHFCQLLRYYFQILRIVDLCTKLIFHIQRTDHAFVRNFVQCIFCIAFHLISLTECHDPVKPDLPVLFLQMIKGLCSQGILKKFNAYFFNLIIVNHCFKILLRKRKCGADRHTALFTFNHLVQNHIFKHQIPMHQQNVILCQCLSGTVDGIDIIGLVIDRIFHKGVSKRQIQALTVLCQYLIMPSGGHDHFFDPLISDLAELTT